MGGVLKQLAVVGLFAAATAVAPGFALAQDGSVEAADGFRVQIYEPDCDGLGYFTTESARIAAMGAPSVMFHANYATGVLAVWSGGDVLDPVVQRQAGMDLLFGMGFEVFDLMLHLPFSVYQAGTGMAGEPLPGRPFGDLQARLKVRIVDPDIHRVGGAVALAVSAPTGGDLGLYGEHTVTVTPVGVVELRRKVVDVGFNLGVRGRPPSEVLGLRLGTQVIYRVAARVKANDVFSGQAEVFGLIGPSHEASPAHWLAGVRVQTARGFWIRVGAGTGIGVGYGAARGRLVFGIGVSRPTEPNPDRDGDGIPNLADRCQSRPEDVDGVEDEDGCPDAEPDALADDEDDREPYTRDPPTPLLAGAFCYCLGVDLRDGGAAEDGEESRTLRPAPGRGLALDEAQFRAWLGGFDALPRYGYGLRREGDQPDPPASHLVRVFSVGWVPALREGAATRSGSASTPDLASTPGLKQPPSEMEGDLASLDDDGERITLADPVLFDLGAARLRPRAFAALNRVADLLAAHPELRLVEIRATSGDSPGRSEIGRTRAEAVLRYLVGRGVDEERLTAVGVYPAPSSSGRIVDPFGLAAGGEAGGGRVELRVVTRGEP